MVLYLPDGVRVFQIIVQSSFSFSLREKAAD
jgi:hypothetical protein